jgi:hypothetical protein
MAPFTRERDLEEQPGSRVAFSGAIHHKRDREDHPGSGVAILRARATKIATADGGQTLQCTATGKSQKLSGELIGVVARRGNPSCLSATSGDPQRRQGVNQPSPHLFKKFWRRWCPLLVRMLSGWNCTPSTSTSRWRIPMIIPSAVVAVISSSAGSELGSMTNE